MRRYTATLKECVRQLRELGKTYSEIKKAVELSIPKSSLSDICRNVKLPREYSEIVKELNNKNLNKARSIAAASHILKKRRLLESLRQTNRPIAKKIKDKETAKIALAMLCLGEASKSRSGASFYLGSSDVRIIILFLKLLKYCYQFNMSKVRCTIQCRADQSVHDLERYWQNITGIPKENFYKTRVDARSIDKPTQKMNYKGVLRIDYLDRSIQFDLESLADLVYNTVS